VNLANFLGCILKGAHLILLTATYNMERTMRRKICESFARRAYHLSDDMRAKT